MEDVGEPKDNYIKSDTLF